MQPAKSSGTLDQSSSLHSVLWPIKNVSQWCNKCDKVIVLKPARICENCKPLPKCKPARKTRECHKCGIKLGKRRTVCENCKAPKKIWCKKLCECGALLRRYQRKCQKCRKPKETKVNGHKVNCKALDYPIKVCKWCAKPIKKGQRYLVWHNLHLSCYEQNPFPVDKRRRAMGHLGGKLAQELRQITKDQCPLDEIIPQDVAEDVWGAINRIRAKNAELRGQDVEFCL